MTKILVYLLFSVSCYPLLVYGNDAVSVEGVDLWAEAVERERMLPAEKLNTGYFLTKQGNLIPANVSTGNGIAYLWKGVVLTQAQVPRLNISGSYAITPFNIPEFQIKLELKEIEPKISYLSLSNGKYAMGYYDRLRKIFFQWNGLEYEKADIPKEAEAEGLIVYDDESTLDFLKISEPTEVSHDLDLLKKEYYEALEAKCLLKSPKSQASELLILEKKFVAPGPLTSSAVVATPEPTPSPVPVRVVAAIPEPKSSPWCLIVASVVLIVLVSIGLLRLMKKFDRASL
jgi:hypothetical protein